MGTLYTLVGLAVAGLIIVVPMVGWGWGWFGRGWGWAKGRQRGGGVHGWQVRCVVDARCRAEAGQPLATPISLLPPPPLQVKDDKSRRLAAYGMLGLAVMAFRWVTANHHWKTGMTTHWYWP